MAPHSPAVRHGRATQPRLERLWRWPVMATMLATIPAFYSELQEATPAAWAEAAYLLAALVLAGAVVHSGVRNGHLARHLLNHALDLVLAVGLLAAALGPASSHSGGALALRLGVAFMSMAHMVWAVHRSLARGSVLHMLGVAFVVLLLCGAGFWWLEPTTPTLAGGLWLAFTTAATVGYGDVVPTTPASRIFAVFVVLLGFGVITVVTAAIAANWVETKERLIEREILRDLHQQVAALRGEIAEMRSELRDAERD